MEADTDEKPAEADTQAEVAAENAADNAGPETAQQAMENEMSGSDQGGEPTEDDNQKQADPAPEDGGDAGDPPPTDPPAAEAADDGEAAALKSILATRVVPIGYDNAIRLDVIAARAEATEEACLAVLNAGRDRNRFAVTNDDRWYQPGE